MILRTVRAKCDSTSAHYNEPQKCVEHSADLSFPGFEVSIRHASEQKFTVGEEYRITIQTIGEESAD